MPLVETPYEHIVLNDNQVPVIEGTTMKVVELLEGHTAYGWNADELLDQYPYLSLGQIYSALAFYWDHKEELDLDMQRRDEYVAELQRNAEPWPLRERLKAQGLI